MCCHMHMRQPATTINTNTDSSSITSDGYVALTHILCNSSSILITHRSNHTHKILCNELNKQMLPDSIKSPLGLKRKNNTSQAAHLKIATIHSNENNINMQPFVDMDLMTLPGWPEKTQCINVCGLCHRCLRRSGAKVNEYGWTWQVCIFLVLLEEYFIEEAGKMQMQREGNWNASYLSFQPHMAIIY